jgi:hypothetical protein
LTRFNSSTGRERNGWPTVVIDQEAVVLDSSDRFCDAKRDGGQPTVRAKAVLNALAD